MFSNCLLEAIKAKIENPSLEIKLIPPSLNQGRIHFYWTDGRTIWHYNNKCERKNPFARILFNGILKECGSTFFESLMLHKMYEKGLSEAQALKLSKKYRLPFTEGDIKSAYFNESQD